MKLLNFTKLSLVVLFAMSVRLQAQTLSNITPVTSDGEYIAPVWSPDGTKLLFTGHHNDELYILDLNSDQKIEKLKEGLGIGYRASWSLSGDKVIFSEKLYDGVSKTQVKSIDIKTRVETVLPYFHLGNLKQPVHYLRRAEEQLIVYVNTKTLKIEAKYGDEGEPWVITKEEGSFYEPLVSPNEKFVVVHEGANIYKYAVDGSISRQDLGKGLATSWTPDSKSVLTFEDSSTDGHNLSASELFVVKMSDLQKKQLTFSKDRIETWADISPNGLKIAFSDEKSGQIFIADLKL